LEIGAVPELYISALFEPEKWEKIAYLLPQSNDRLFNLPPLN